MKLNKLKEIRERKGYSQTEFANKIGLNRSFLAQIESGKAKMPEKYIEKTCIILGVAEGEVFDISEEKKIDDTILNYAIDIADSITDASDLTKKQRLLLVHRIYDLINEVFEKKLTNEQLDDELKKLREEVKKDANESKEMKQNIFKLFKQKLTNDSKDDGSKN